MHSGSVPPVAASHYSAATHSSTYHAPAPAERSAPPPKAPTGAGKGGKVDTSA